MENKKSRIKQEVCDGRNADKGQKSGIDEKRTYTEGNYKTWGSNGNK